MQTHSTAPADPATAHIDASLQRAIIQAKADWYTYLVASWDEDNGMPYPHASRLVLEDWTRPAADHVEAIMALSLALEQYAIGDTPVIPSMIKAALGFLERQAS
ncbi:hypothetical protein [Tianweitania sp.]|uniref:hypothetical protein n=1 Tax=Tianweitania sp. TaxID=2021634 RepID=UPI00289FB8B1|nr:hypothetical protein [Tianweitania sp.]